MQTVATHPGSCICPRGGAAVAKQLYQIYHASGDTTRILSEAISISRRPRHGSPPEAKLVVNKSGLWSNLVHSEYVSVYQNSLH